MFCRACLLALFVIGLAGCASGGGNRLTLRIVNTTQVCVDGWVMSEDDLRTILNERKPTSVTIDGNAETPWSKAQALKRMLNDCGIKDVVIGHAGKAP